MQRARKMMLHRTPENEDAFQATLDETEALAPLWQRISGISPRTELLMEPGERRAGIRRLLRVVERMFRDEWKSEDLDKEGGPTKLESGEVSFAGRSAVWEPLHEICLYLGISKAKLDGLSLQRTGLRVREMCDCIRVEGVRASLRDKFRPLVREWMERLEESGGKTSFADDFTNAAWRFVKWMRGGGRCETRKKFAFELGMTSRERLDRAVLVCEGETLEALEIEVALRAIQEATSRPFGGTRESVGFLRRDDEEMPHGAGFDGVDVVRDGVRGDEKESA